MKLDFKEHSPLALLGKEATQDIKRKSKVYLIDKDALQTFIIELKSELSKARLIAINCLIS